MTLSWESPDDHSVTGRQILRRRPTQGEDTLPVYVEDAGNTATEYSDLDVTPGVRHVYRVKAISVRFEVQDEWVGRIAELVIDFTERHTQAGFSETFTANLACSLLDEATAKFLVHDLSIRPCDFDVAGQAGYTCEFVGVSVADHLRSLLADAAPKMTGTLATIT